MKTFFIASLSLIILSCENNKVSKNEAGTKAIKDSASFTTIQWLDTIKNIGSLQMGQQVQISFRFKNTGDKPLYIISANPGCGCTVADYPKEAIQQGGEGEIIAAFDTNKGSVGSFKKGITVTTNTRPHGNTLLFFEGEIKQADSRTKK